MNLLDPQYESGIEHSFLTSRSIFKILSLVREPKKQFLWEKNDIVLLFASRGTGLATKTWKKVIKFGEKVKHPSAHKGKW